MKIVVKARHMDATQAIRDYVESKVAKLTRFYGNIHGIEVTLDMEADQPTVEMVATASHKATFVASHRDPDMYACVDQCVDKVAEQMRRFKDRIRHHQGPGLDEAEPAAD